MMQAQRQIFNFLLQHASQWRHDTCNNDIQHNDIHHYCIQHDVIQQCRSMLTIVLTFIMLNVVK